MKTIYFSLLTILAVAVMSCKPEKVQELPNPQETNTPQIYLADTNAGRLQSNFQFCDSNSTPQRKILGWWKMIGSYGAQSQIFIPTSQKIVHLYDGDTCFAWRNDSMYFIGTYQLTTHHNNPAYLLIQTPNHNNTISKLNCDTMIYLGYTTSHDPVYSYYIRFEP